MQDLQVNLVILDRQELQALQGPKVMKAHKEKWGPEAFKVFKDFQVPGVTKVNEEMGDLLGHLVTQDHQDLLELQVHKEVKEFQGLLVLKGKGVPRETKA